MTFILDENLKEYATKRQWEVLTTWQTEGTQRKAAEKIGCAKAAIHSAKAAVLKKAASNGYAPDSDLTHTVPEGFSVKGISDMRVNSLGKPQWVKYDRDKEAITDQMAVALNEFKENLPACTPVPPRGKYSSELMACYPIGDPHFGMMAWNEDAGDDYDLKIAEQLHIDAMSYLIKSAPKCDNALIAILGDLAHYDSTVSVTPTSGHILDSDSRPQKMIRVIIRAVRSMIHEALSHHNNINVIIETGNHDLNGSNWLREAFHVFYENESRVTIDVSPANFHYHRFGKNLIGTHHGDKRIKPQAMPLLMATDRPEDWGNTEHRVWWTGHVHHDQVKDFNGATFESFGILPPTDEHAQSNGYRSKRGGKCIVVHRELGEVARHTVTPEMLR